MDGYFEKGELIGRSEGRWGFLDTKKDDYVNFHLRMETILTDGDGVGLSFRSGPPRGDGKGASYIANIGTSLGGLPTGTLYIGPGVPGPPKVLKVAKAVSLKEGEWFSLEVIATSNRIRVLVKGQTVVDYTDGDHTFTRGKIRIIKRGGTTVLRFRNVEIKELPPADAATPPAPAADGFVPLFNGKDLTGWAGLEDFWSVKDGAISGHETKEGSKQTFLILTAMRPADFELHFSCKFATPEGNSGVQFRSKLIDEKAYRVGGYQADCDAKGDYDGSIYDEAAVAGGRGTMSNCGEKTVWDADNQRHNDKFPHSGDELSDCPIRWLRRLDDNETRHPLLWVRAG